MLIENRLGNSAAAAQTIHGATKMRKCFLSLGAVLALFVSAVQPTKAQTAINVTIGNPILFADGSKQSFTSYTTGVAGQPMPFNAMCGSDTGTGPNCSATWMFGPYAVPPGDSIISASLALGIWDIDSKASGPQVASFTLDGTDVLTTQLNAASEGLNGGMGAPNLQYDVLTITIPGSDLAALTSGSATFTLALQGPGLGVIGNTTYNGAGLVFSSLDMEAMAPLSPTPELSSWMLFLSGMLLVGIKLTLNKLRPGQKAVTGPSFSCRG